MEKITTRLTNPPTIKGKRRKLFIPLMKIALLLFPLLLFSVQELVIKPEEKYLVRRFGREYDDYQNAVRRWL